MDRAVVRLSASVVRPDDTSRTGVDTCINDFNMKAEKNEEDAVRNWRTEVEGNRIIYEMDTGFAGPEILKTLFRLFARMNIFSKVTVQ